MAIKMSIEALFMERIASGLRRCTVTSCSRWAEQFRVMGKPFPGPWTFTHHPWLRAMHDAETTYVWGQKAAQMGYTETVLNKCFYEVDVNGTSALYVLPAKTPDAGDFSSARFDPAVESSPHLQKLFTDVKNIGHKRAGAVNVYIRGSRSRAGLKSIPAGLIILDELEEMTQENIPLVFERASGQVDKQIWGISTPTIDGTGINKLYLASTQEHFFFPCPHCGKKTELLFPDCLVVVEDSIRKSHLICKECKTVLDHDSKADFLSRGFWVASNPDREARGFYINQLYSMTVEPYELAAAYLRALTNAADEQEFYNSKLGLPHIVDGARVTDQQINSCIGDYTTASVKPTFGKLITLGVDVGSWLHYEVDEWSLPAIMLTSDLNIEARVKVLAFGKVRNFEELDLLMHQFQVQFCVIDAQPERRSSFNFAQRFLGFVRMCFYGPGIQGKSISNSHEQELSITVDRTSWLDMALSRFKTRTILLPRNIDTEYRDHMRAPVRIYEKDQNGNPVAKYVNGSDADHYSHTRVYNELALNFAAGLGHSEDIKEDI